MRKARPSLDPAVYEAAASPAFGAPLALFIGCGLAGAVAYALIVRSRGSVD